MTEPTKENGDTSKDVEMTEKEEAAPASADATKAESTEATEKSSEEAKETKTEVKEEDAKMETASSEAKTSAGDGAGAGEKKEDKAKEENTAAESSASKPSSGDGAGEKKDDNGKEEKAEKKSEAAASPEVLKAVVERLRFFFGDANVRHDNFLRRLLMSPPGVVPIETLLRFNTVKQHTTDPDVVRQAAKTLSDRLTVTEDGKGLQRVKPFTKELMDENIPVSLLVEDLPIKRVGEKRFYDTNVGEITKMFDQYGTVAMVKLRFYVATHTASEDTGDDLIHGPNGKAKGKVRKGPRLPRGSALVEFETVGSLEKAAADTITVSKEGKELKPARKLELGGKVLKVRLLSEFVETCRKRKAEREAAKPEEKDDGDKKEKEEEPEPKDKKEKKEPKVFKMDWKPGCVIKITGLAESCDREAILDAISEGLGKTLDEVKELKVYADYSRGQKDGAIRFHEPELADQMLAKLTSDLQVAGAKVESARKLEGEEETKYWNDFIEFKTKQIRQRDAASKSKYKKQRRH